MMLISSFKMMQSFEQKISDQGGIFFMGLGWLKFLWIFRSGARNDELLHGELMWLRKIFSSINLRRVYNLKTRWNIYNTAWFWLYDCNEINVIVLVDQELPI